MNGPENYLATEDQPTEKDWEEYVETELKRIEAERSKLQTDGAGNVIEQYK